MISVSLNPKKSDEKLDPRSINYTNEFYLLENLTCRLVSLDEHGNYQLDLASDLLKISETEFHFKIKKTFFSNGEVITLNDVRNTILRIMKSGSSHVDFRDIISSVEIIDLELVVKLAKPSKSFFYYLSLPDLGILHSSQSDKEELHARDFIPLSSGPFYYSVKDGDYSLRKNKNYTLTPPQYPDEVLLKDPFSGDTVRDILNGTVQLGQGSTKSFLKLKSELQKSKNIRVLGVPSDSLTYLYFNNFSSNLKDVRVRRLIAKKIRNSFTVSSGYSDIARSTNQYFPPESIAFLSENEIKEIFNENDKELPLLKIPEEIVIHTFTSVYDVTIEQLVRSLESIPGLKVKIKADVKPSDYIDSMKNGKFDLFLNIMSTDIRTPVEAINFEYFSPDSNLEDVTGVIKKEFLKYQDSTSREDERNHMKAISRQIIKDGQIIPLFHSAIPFLYDSENVSLTGLSHLFVMNFWKLKTI